MAKRKRQAGTAETLADKDRIFFNGNKTTETSRKLENFLMDNGFERTFSGSTNGGWNGDVDVIQIKFRRGMENVYITVNKPKEGVIQPMSYEEYIRQKEAGAMIPQSKGGEYYNARSEI